MKRKNISRRKFIGTSACAAMGSLPVLSSILNLGMINSLAAAPSLLSNDYKALICIGLRGGNDSFNMLVPYGNDEYNQYSTVRGNLALSTNEILPITSLSDQKEYGIHHKMPGTKALFDDGNLAFIANVGTLVEPIANATVYENLAADRKPFYVGSHKDQFQQWQTSVPQDSEVSGWGGRMADILHGLHNDSNISMNISLGGRNFFQTSATTMEYSISNVGNGASGIKDFTGAGYNNGGFIEVARSAATDNILAETYSNILQQTFSQQFKSAIELNRHFEQVLGNTPIESNFSNNSFSQDLKMVARTIKAQSALSMNRQTFFVSLGSWDHHENLKSQQEDLLEVLSQGLQELYAALEEIEMQDKVTTFSISDFGRTITGNGNIGSDHGWGGHQFVMGGAVKGQEVYGIYPDLSLNNPLNIHPRGSLIPTTSTDEFFAELALWFGVSSGNLEDILPNISNFSSNLPISFMNV